MSSTGRWPQITFEWAQTPRPEGAPDLHAMATRRMSEFESKQMKWYTPNRAPRFGLCGLDGDPGKGKSAIVHGYLPARLTTGRPIWGGEPFEPVNCLLVTTENHPEYTVRPQLEALGADLERVHWHVLDRDEDGLPIPLSFPDGLLELRDDIKRTKAKYVALDPASSYYGEQINSHSDASLRRVLDPLADLADQLKVWIVLVRHLIKDTKVTNALYRGGGSIAFTGACRLTYLVADAPAGSAYEVSLNGAGPAQTVDMAAGLKVLAQVKNNLGPKQPSLEYELVEAEKGVPIPEWRGETPLTADDLLRQPKPSKEPTEKERAAKLVEQFLGRRARPAKEVYAAGREEGIDDEVLKKVEGVHRFQETKGGRRRWIWHMAKYPGPKQCSKCRRR